MKNLLITAVFAGLTLGVALPALAGEDPRPTPAVPEPSSALIFGAGLLVASQVARKRRR